MYFAIMAVLTILVYSLDIVTNRIALLLPFIVLGIFQMNAEK
jgi:hypothetical protein